MHYSLILNTPSIVKFLLPEHVLEEVLKHWDLHSFNQQDINIHVIYHVDA